MLGIPTSQIPVYREETKPRFCPAHYQSHGDHSLSTSRVKACGSGAYLFWRHRAPVACGTLSNMARLGSWWPSAEQAEGQKVGEKHSLQCLWPRKTCSSWHSHIQSNKKTCLRSYKEGVDLKELFTRDLCWYYRGPHPLSRALCHSPHSICAVSPMWSQY